MSWKYVRTQFHSTSRQMITIYISLSHTLATCNIFHKKAFKNNHFLLCACVHTCLVNVWWCAQPLPLLVQQHWLCWQTCVMRMKKGRATKGKENLLLFFQVAHAFLKMANRATWHKCLHAHMSFRHILRVLGNNSWRDKVYLEGQMIHRRKGLALVAWFSSQVLLSVSYCSVWSRLEQEAHSTEYQFLLSTWCNFMFRPATPN